MKHCCRASCWRLHPEHVSGFPGAGQPGSCCHLGTSASWASSGGSALEEQQPMVGEDPSAYVIASCRVPLGLAAPADTS